MADPIRGMVFTTHFTDGKAKTGEGMLCMKDLVGLKSLWLFVPGLGSFHKDTYHL